MSSGFHPDLWDLKKIACQSRSLFRIQVTLVKIDIATPLRVSGMTFVIILGRVGDGLQRR